VKQTQFMASLGVMSAGALWGLLWYPLVEFDKQGMGIGISSTIFYAVAALSAFIGVVIAGQLQQVAKALLTPAILGTAFTFYTFALLLTHPFNAILLFYLTPAWSIIFGKIAYGERISLVRCLVIIIGFVGVSLVLGATSLPIPKNLGDWIALLSGALWALGTSMASKEKAKNSFVFLLQFAVAGLVSTIILTLALVGIEPKVLAATADFSVYIWAVVAGLVLFAGPNFLVLWGTNYLSSTRVGVLLMMEVVVGTIAISQLSAHPITAIQIAGAVMVFTAGILEALSRDSKTV
jgi:drug/metabolite transporter (DMT)-like permease